MRKLNVSSEKGATLGDKIKNLRKGKGLSQEEAAALIGMDRTTVSNYERDERQPSYDVLVRMAESFHTSTDYLFGVKGNPMNEEAHLLRLIPDYKYEEEQIKS